jgi:hypothetical protein
LHSSAKALRFEPVEHDRGEVKMQVVYTVGMDENKRIAADRLGKELGAFENQLGKIGQFLPVTFLPGGLSGRG